MENNETKVNEIGFRISVLKSKWENVFHRMRQKSKIVPRIHDHWKSEIGFWVGDDEPLAIVYSGYCYVWGSVSVPLNSKYVQWDEYIPMFCIEIFLFDVYVGYDVVLIPLNDVENAISFSTYASPRSSRVLLTKVADNNDDQRASDRDEVDQSWYWNRSMRNSFQSLNLWVL